MLLIKKIIFLIVLNNYLINVVISKEFRLTTFLNPYCDGVPSITLSSTTCSPDNYFHLLDNNTSITNTNINSNKHNCNENYTKSHGYDIFPINQCVAVDEEDESSYSIIMSYNSNNNPRSIDGFCNQFNFFDCDNYNIVSFKNGSCFVYDDYHIKQTCDQDFIYFYKCDNGCKDSSCRFDKREPNNIDNDCSKKSIEINDLKSNNNTIITITKPPKQQQQTTVNNKNEFSEKSNSLNSNSISLNSNSSYKRKPIDTQVFEKFNDGSKLFSNSILILILIISLIL